MENVFFPSLGFLVDILLVCEMPTVRTQEKNLLKPLKTHVAYPIPNVFAQVKSESNTLIYIYIYAKYINIYGSKKHLYTYVLDL